MTDARRCILDVGNCDPDHSNIRGMLEANFEVQIDRVMFVADAVAQLQQKRFDLVMVNRLIFDDGSDGGELIRRMQKDGFADTPVMMISNYAESQQAALADGAVQGFGKGAICDPSTIKLLSSYLG